MISLGSRYVDYGLTGGFFLFLAAALFWWLDPVRAAALLKCAHAQLVANSDENLEPLITGVLTSLFVVCVFAAGLLLDLVGSMFIAYEARIFRHHLKHNKEWLEPFLKRYEDYLGDDVEQLLLGQNWRRLKSWFDVTAPVRMVLQMGRIESILLSHLLLTTDRTKIEYIVDQLRTCRLARAITSGSGILLFVCLAYLAVKVISTIGTVSETLGPLGTGAELGREAIIAASMGKVVALNILVWLASIVFVAIVWLAYSKFCRSLFSSIHVLMKSEKNESLPGSV